MMECVECKNPMGSREVPGGAYMCDNEYWQCAECTDGSKGRCFICKANMQCVNISFEKAKNSANLMEHSSKPVIGFPYHQESSSATRNPTQSRAMPGSNCSENRITWTNVSKSSCDPFDFVDEKSSVSDLSRLGSFETSFAIGLKKAYEMIRKLPEDPDRSSVYHSTKFNSSNSLNMEVGFSGDKKKSVNVDLHISSSKSEGYLMRDNEIYPTEMPSTSFSSSTSIANQHFRNIDQGKLLQSINKTLPTDCTFEKSENPMNNTTGWEACSDNTIIASSEVECSSGYLSLDNFEAVPNSEKYEKVVKNEIVLGAFAKTISCFPMTSTMPSFQSAAIKPADSRRNSHDVTKLKRLQEDQSNPSNIDGNSSKHICYVVLVPDMEPSPARCPDSMCRLLTCKSAMIEHLMYDHSCLIGYQLSPGETRDFFIEPQLAHLGLKTCHLLFLLREKIVDFGSPYFKNLLPLVVMSTRLSLAPFCGAEGDCMMIWPLGFIPKSCPLIVTLRVCSFTDDPVPMCEKTITGQVIEMTALVTLADIFTNGTYMLLSTREVELLTNNESKMIRMQITLH